MLEGTSIAQHLNNFTMITNHLYYIDIEFDDEIKALIMLALLSNSWEAMRIVVSNSIGNMELSYDDVSDMILTKKVCRKDSRELFGTSMVLSIDNKLRT